MSLEKEITKMAQSAKKESYALGLLSTEQKNEALKAMAAALLAKSDYIVAQNKKDLRVAEKQKYPKALVGRLTLNEKLIKEMAQGLEDIIKLPDPVGQIFQTIDRPNGLKIQKVRVPIGVVGIIYESRPNVASDCLGLCLKSGNAVILKGGKEAAYSNEAIFKVLRDSLSSTKIPTAAVQMIPSTKREAVNVLLKLNKYVDLIVPRGGESLINFVVEHSRIPVVKHDKGICHTYVSEHADLNMAHKICYNAKVQRPGVCNAMETMLVHKNSAVRFLPGMVSDFQKSGVEIRGCPVTRRIVKNGVKPATKKDWETEYLDLILSVKVVDSFNEAVAHINTFGSHHSDAIVTDDEKEGEKFLKSVDSACLYVNASTRFTDGYQFGLGGEIGISTNKLHARGPMALEELTTYKFVVHGKGQIRE
ncbi:MAG TPA: glutamate-5-semialdehyde dehydrogenase [Candidatus Omnitrophota bacterium]|nr:glutamate-5-semialdehyde dehydrogenase [Candidatus Omnitrophota bacterium]